MARISVSFIPRVVSAAVPILIPEVMNGLRLSNGTMFLLTVIPAGLPHCDELGGCLRDKLGVASGERHEISRAVHAEQNAIIQASIHGISIKGATVYATNQPCSLCTKMLVNAGVYEFVISDGYPDDLAVEIMKLAGVTIRKIDYPNKSESEA